MIIVRFPTKTADEIKAQETKAQKLAEKEEKKRQKIAKKARTSESSEEDSLS